MDINHNQTDRTKKRKHAKAVVAVAGLMVRSSRRNLVLHRNRIKVYFTSVVPLIVVADLEVASRRMQLVSAENLPRAVIETDAEHVLLVSYFIRELFAHGDIANWREVFTTAGACEFHSHDKISAGAVVQLTDRPRRDIIIHMNLANHSAVSAVIRMGHRKGCLETVFVGFGVPTLWGHLSELSAAVFTVRCCDAVRRIW